MTRARSRHGASFALAFVLLGCSRLGCGTAPLAELLTASGRVERDFAAHVGTWQAAPKGTTFDEGDGLRTDKGASALVRIGARSRARVESETIIRFSTKASGGSASGEAAAPSVELEQGKAVIEAGDADLPIQTAAGRAVLRRGSRVELVRTSALPGEKVAATHYRVLMGGATFSQADGKSVAVGAGQSIAIGIGLAVLDPDDEPRAAQAKAAPATTAGATTTTTGASPNTDAGPKAADPAAAANAARDEPANDATGKDPLAAGATKEAAAISGEGGRPEVSVPIGESFRVYDAHPPALIGFRVESRCPAGAELAVDERVLRGSREIELSLAPGTYSYKARCLNAAGQPERAATRGSVRVLRGDGARPLPKTAPHNDIELDGRRYTLMYQNLRPVITVTWPNAPKASGYTFVLRTPDGHTTRTPEREPRHVVASDALLDGTHGLSMQAAGAGGTRSKETLVDVTFDNAAPTASIESPAASGFDPGGSVRVAGVALEGSRISVGERAIALDRTHRFSQSIALAPGQTAIAIRFQHAAYGIRYYLRRARGDAR